MNTTQTIVTPIEVANQIRRQLIKAQAEMVIGAIHVIIAKTQVEYNEYDATIVSKNAREDRVGGRNIVEYFNTGIKGQAVSVANALKSEFPGTEAESLSSYLGGSIFGEFFSQNKANLEEIVKVLTRLATKL